MTFKKKFGFSVVAIILGTTVGVNATGECFDTGCNVGGGSGTSCFLEGGGTASGWTQRWYPTDGSSDTTSFFNSMEIWNGSSWTSTEGAVAPLVDGTIYEFRYNSSVIVSATWHTTTGFDSVTLPCTPTPTAVPVGPFGLLALLAGILGSAFVGLRGKKA